MFSYTATIGRNYSTGSSVFPSMRGKTMTLTAWHQFIEDVTADMRASFFPAQIEAVEVHYGKGSWAGVEEDSAKITVLAKSALPEDPEESALHLGVLRNYLSENARQYGQDAIALTIGQSELC